MHALRVFLIVFAGVSPAIAQSCYNNQGTCKYTSACKGPMYYSKPGYCPGPTNYQCCIPTGCVVCSGDSEEAKDLEARRPCC
ncbi:hypothetical protein GGG16DRAFT_113222 [Schizophyllum commune]